MASTTFNAALTSMWLAPESRMTVMNCAAKGRLAPVASTVRESGLFITPDSTNKEREVRERYA